MTDWTSPVGHFLYLLNSVSQGWARNNDYPAGEKEDCYREVEVVH